jgi:hypothetical protein
MSVLDFISAIAPLPLGLIAALLIAIALLQPRHVPARNVSQIREVRLPR